MLVIRPYTDKTISIYFNPDRPMEACRSYNKLEDCYSSGSSTLEDLVDILCLLNPTSMIFNDTYSRLDSVYQASDFVEEGKYICKLYKVLKLRVRNDDLYDKSINVRMKLMK